MIDRFRCNAAPRFPVLIDEQVNSRRMKRFLPIALIVVALLVLLLSSYANAGVAARPNFQTATDHARPDHPGCNGNGNAQPGRECPGRQSGLGQHLTSCLPILIPK